MAHKILRLAIRHQTAVELTASRGFTEIAPLTTTLLCSHWNSSVCPEKCPPVLDYLQDIVNLSSDESPLNKIIICDPFQLESE